MQDRCTRGVEQMCCRLRDDQKTRIGLTPPYILMLRRGGLGRLLQKSGFDAGGTGDGGKGGKGEREREEGGRETYLSISLSIYLSV